MTEESPPTICNKCRHVSKTFDDYHIWSCLVPFEQKLNHVTGKMEPAKIWCHSKNHGKCPDYEEADRDEA